MNLLALIATACLGFNPQLVISPDQPLQFSYLDEPLVIAIQSDVTGAAEASAQVKSPRGGAAQEVALGSLNLRAGEETWVALPTLPPGEGYFSIEVTLSHGGESKTLHGGFARIRRSTGEHNLPIVAYGEEADAATLRALRSAPVPALRVDLLADGSAERAAALVKQGFKLVPYLDARLTTDPGEVARRAAELWCGSILRWQVAAGASVSLLEDVSRTVRATQCPAPVVAVVDDIDTFKSLIENGLGNVVRAVAVEVKENGQWTVAAVQSIAEQAGFEQWDVYALLPPPERGAEEQNYLTKRIFLALAEGFKSVSFHARELYDQGLTAAFSRINALSFQMGDMTFAGSLPVDRGIQNALFKEGGDWFLVIWSNAGSKDILLEVGDAGKLRAVDQFNQSIELPAVTKGALPLKVDNAPIFVTGRGGSVFDQAARPIARRLASELAKRKELMDVLGPEVGAAVNSAVLSEGAVTQRTNFFAMLRALPELERRWHQGELPRHLAVSAISHLARLMRQVCVVEQQRGEPFLEPLQDTLARCEEYQAYYLTSSRGSDDAFERGDWLLGEVRRLMNESNDLAAANRRIEASAVAALAEWRARGLEFAANAGERPVEDNVTVALALPDKPPAPLLITAPAAPGADVPAEGIYVVKRGDTLGGIAAKYKVPLKDLLEWNKLTTKSRINIGQKIQVAAPGTVAAAPAPAPSPAAAPAPAPERAPAPAVEEKAATPEPAPAPAEGGKIHVVKRGESPASIAAKHKVKLDDLLKWNQLTTKSRLSIGQELKVSAPASAPSAAPEKAVEAAPESAAPEEKAVAPASAPADGIYIVKRGDTPAGIAQKHGVSLDDLLRWNSMTKKSRLDIGQKIRVSGDAAPVAQPEAPAPREEVEETAGAAGTKKVMHTVERGETTRSIANKYGVAEADFRKWNSIRAGAQLARGKQYVVYVPQRGAKAKPRAPEKPQEKSAPAPSGKKIEHTVKRGESPYVISQKYNVPLDDLLKWNNLTKKSRLDVGDKLVVYTK